MSFKNFTNYNSCKSAVDESDLHGQYLNLLSDIVDLDTLASIDKATNGTACDVYHFKIDGSKKYRHIGLYNNRIEFDYYM